MPNAAFGALPSSFPASQVWMAVSSMFVGAGSERTTGAIATAGPTPYSATTSVQYVVPPTVETNCCASVSRS